MTDKILSLSTLEKEFKVKRDSLKTTYSSAEVVATITNQDGDGRRREKN